MLKQVVLIDLTGQQHVLPSTKFRFTYANGGQINLELARQWHEAGINLSCEYRAQAQLTTESEISSHLLLRPNGADEIYLNPKTQYTKNLINSIPKGQLIDIKASIEKKQASNTMIH